MEISWPLQMLVAFLFAFISSYLAIKKGRNPLTWGILGFFFGVFGFFFLLFLPKKGKIVAYQESESATDELPPSEKLEPHKEDILIEGELLSEEKFPGVTEGQEWYFLDTNQKQHGPLSFTELKKSWETHLLTTQSYIWTLGWDQWHRIEEYGELKQQLEL